ncbi:MAG: hypothetical protein JWQ09_6100 [Segetibacter sp.]|nr:hypothetical protein [Segetibacter sp.]
MSMIYESGIKLFEAKINEIHSKPRVLNEVSKSVRLTLWGRI